MEENGTVDWLSVVRHILSAVGSVAGVAFLQNGDTVAAVATGLVAVGAVVWGLLKNKKVA